MGIGCDHCKDTIVASPKWWNRKLQEKHAVKKYHDIAHWLLDEHQIFFEDVVATVHYVWTPSSGVVPPEMQEENLGDDFHNEEEVVNGSANNPNHNLTPIPLDATSSMTMKNQFSSTSRWK